MLAPGVAVYKQCLCLCRSLKECLHHIVMPYYVVFLFLMPANVKCDLIVSVMIWVTHSQSGIPPIQIGLYTYIISPHSDICIPHLNKI